MKIGRRKKLKKAKIFTNRIFKNIRRGFLDSSSSYDWCYGKEKMSSLIETKDPNNCVQLLITRNYVIILPHKVELNIIPVYETKSGTGCIWVGNFEDLWLIMKKRIQQLCSRVLRYGWNVCCDWYTNAKNNYQATWYLEANADRNQSI